jgi:hypothetical protein
MTSNEILIIEYVILYNMLYIALLYALKNKLKILIKVKSQLIHRTYSSYQFDKNVNICL